MAEEVRLGSADVLTPFDKVGTMTIKAAFGRSDAPTPKHEQARRARCKLEDRRSGAPGRPAHRLLPPDTAMGEGPSHKRTCDGLCELVFEAPCPTDSSLGGNESGPAAPSLPRFRAALAKGLGVLARRLCAFCDGGVDTAAFSPLKQSRGSRLTFPLSWLQAASSPPRHSRAAPGRSEAVERPQAPKGQTWRVQAALTETSQAAATALQQECKGQSSRNRVSCITSIDTEELEPVRSAAFHENWIERAAAQEPGQLHCTLSAVWHFVWLAAYIIATLVLAGRATLIATGTQWKFEDCCMAFGLPCIYFLIGVIVPIFSWQVAKSAPMMCILTHRYHYQDIEDESMPFMIATQVVRPLSQVAGLVAPTLTSLQLWQVVHAWRRGAGLVVTNFTFSTPLPLLLCTFVGLAGMLFFGSGWVDEFVLDASLVSIEGLIHEIGEPPVDVADSELEVGRQQFRWNELAIHHRALNLALTRLWDVPCAGGLWILRIAILMASSLMLGGLSVSHEDARVRWTWGIAGVVLALGAVILLLRLAAATARCSDIGADARSILTVSRDFSGLHMGAADAEAYRAFMLYLNTAEMGISIWGIMITYGCVLNIASKVIVYIPLALQALGHVLRTGDAVVFLTGHVLG